MTTDSFCLFFEISINGIVKYALCLLFPQHFVCEIHLYCCMQLILIALQYSIVYAYILQCVHSPSCWWTLVGFQFTIIVNKAALNSLLLVLVCICTHLCVGKQKWNCFVCIYLESIDYIKIFYEVVVLIYTHTRKVWQIQSPLLRRSKRKKGSHCQVDQSDSKESETWESAGLG